MGSPRNTHWTCPPLCESMRPTRIGSLPLISFSSTLKDLAMKLTDTTIEFVCDQQARRSSMGLECFRWGIWACCFCSACLELAPNQDAHFKSGCLEKLEVGTTFVCHHIPAFYKHDQQNNIEYIHILTCSRLEINTSVPASQTGSPNMLSHTNPTLSFQA